MKVSFNKVFVLLALLLLIVLPSACQDVPKEEEEEEEETLLERVGALLERVETLESEVASLRRQVRESSTVASTSTRTFSSVLKSHPIYSGVETLCFEKNDTAGFVTHLWVTIGDDLPMRLRFYIDGESEPSIDMDVILGLTSAGFNDRSNPWGTTLMGKGAHSGANFNTMRIPFSQSIRITAVLDVVVPDFPPETFFFIVHGLENAPLQVAGFSLPVGARLRLHRLENQLVRPLDYVTLANVTAHAGLLYQTTMQMQGSIEQYLYLEACMRVYIDGATTPMFLSSGTEDYFNSAMYFDGGEFRLPNSGCTHKNESLAQVSAYRVHDRDPVLFHQDLALVWRNSEDLACPFTFPWPPSSIPDVKPPKIPPHLPVFVNLTSYVWVYEW